MLAAALGQLGESYEARKTWDELMKINPDYFPEIHIDRLSFRDPATAAPIIDGLKKAALIK